MVSKREVRQEGHRRKFLAVVDSTPIIRRLEAEYPGRSVIPRDPVLRFLDELLEDLILGRATTSADNHRQSSYQYPHISQLHFATPGSKCVW